MLENVCVYNLICHLTINKAEQNVSNKHSHHQVCTQKSSDLKPPLIWTFQIQFMSPHITFVCNIHCIHIHQIMYNMFPNAYGIDVLSLSGCLLFPSLTSLSVKSVFLWMHRSAGVLWPRHLTINMLALSTNMNIKPLSAYRLKINWQQLRFCLASKQVFKACLFVCIFVCHIYCSHCCSVDHSPLLFQQRNMRCCDMPLRLCVFNKQQ